MEGTSHHIHRARPTEGGFSAYTGSEIVVSEGSLPGLGVGIHRPQEGRVDGGNNASPDEGQQHQALVLAAPGGPVSSGSSRLPALEAEHLSVVEDLNRHQYQGESYRGQAKFPVASGFVRVAKRAVPEGGVIGHQLGYATAWEILRNILEGEGWDDEGHNVGAEKRHLEGTLDYLEGSFRKHLESKVRKAASTNRLTSPPSMDSDTSVQAYVRAYIDLMTQEEHLKGVMLGSQMYKCQPVWAQIYWCMRCGQNDQASEVASKAAEQSTDEDSECLQAVAEYLQLLPKGSQGIGLGRGNTMDTLKDTLKRRYNSAGAVQSFEKAVLNILLADNPNSMTALSKASIEDYMWFKLSFVSRQLQDNPHNLPCDSSTLQSVQAQLRGVEGPARFDPHGRTPFSYINALLYTQQLECAVAYLYWRGDVLEALHMALAMSYHGAYNLNPEDQYSANLPGALQPPPSLEDMIGRYTRELQHNEPEACAQYLVRLPLPARSAHHALSQLLVATRPQLVGLLVGEVKEDGQRLQGLFDKFFSADVVAHISKSAAEQAHNQGKRREAIQLWGLAGRWDEAAKHLGWQLSQLVSPDANARQAWRGLSQRHYTMLHRMCEGRHAQDQGLIKATAGLHCLLKIMDFFDLAQERRGFQALKTLEVAGVLPQMNEDITEVAYHIRSMGIDDALRACLGQVLVTAMRCIKDEYTYTKQDMMTPGVVDADERKNAGAKHLRDLQFKARLVVGLAGRLARLLPEGIEARLSRMETALLM
ncbi:unnamed protein product [Discosporangium mesarthrocarpum]